MIDSALQGMLPVASWLLFASLKSTAIIVLVLLVRWLFARWLTPQGRYALWFAVVAGLVIPFGMHVSVGAAPEAIAMPAPQPVARLPAAGHELPIVHLGVPPAVPRAPLSASSIAILCWMLGFAVLSAMVARNVYRYARLRAMATDVDEATSGLAHDCRRALNMRRGVRLLESTAVASPIVVGHWRPTLLLPAHLTRHISHGQLRLVLLHELMHVKRHDIVVNWLLTVVQVLHWPNPFAWLALRAMRQDMELACDAGVLRLLPAGGKTGYGDMLIRLADFAPRPALLAQAASVVGGRSGLESRIRMIARYRPRGIASTLLAAALLAVMGAMAVTQAGSPAPASAPTPTIATSPEPATAPVSAAKSAPSPARKPSPASIAATKAAGTRTAAATAPVQSQKPDAPLESAQFAIQHVKATVLATFIRSAPGTGLLSDRGSLAADPDTNTLFVQDTPEGIATIRQLVARLDVPLKNFAIRTIFVVADADLLRELVAVRSSDGGPPQLIILGANVPVATLLDAARQAGRVEVISTPYLLIADRERASLQQTAHAPKRGDEPSSPSQGDVTINLALMPTARPDDQVALDFDVTVDRKMSVPGKSLDGTTAPTMVPAIDTNQAKTQLLLKSGETAMVDIMSDRLAGIEPGSGRRLVAFVTATPAPEPAVHR